MVRSVLAAWLMIVGWAWGAGRDIPVPSSDAFAATWDHAGFSHDLWSAVLARHVDERGLVDYATLSKDARFREYLYRLANTRAAGLVDGKARLAFWINAYNALVIQGVLETLPEDSSRRREYSVLEVTVPGVTQPGKGFFVGLRFTVGGRRYVLDEIEKAVLLQHPSWALQDSAWYASVGPDRPDPRIHFALVCAAKGCPKLWRKAYEGVHIDAQLDEATRRFARDPQQAVFDRASGTMWVSQLLDWYRKDFTDPRMSPHAGSVAAFLSRYVDDGALARSLSQETWRTDYLQYDWKLNVR